MTKFEKETQAARRVVKAVYEALKKDGPFDVSAISADDLNNEDLKSIESLIRAAYLSDEVSEEEYVKSREEAGSKDHADSIFPDKKSCLYTAIACVLFDLDPNDAHPYSHLGRSLQRIAAAAIYAEKSGQFYMWRDKGTGRAAALRELKEMSGADDYALDCLLYI